MLGPAVDQIDPYGAITRHQDNNAAGCRPRRIFLGILCAGLELVLPGFGAPGSGVTIPGDRTRQELTMWSEWRGTVGNLDAGLLGTWWMDVERTTPVRSARPSSALWL